jgi:hypothetical protein
VPGSFQSFPGLVRGFGRLCLSSDHWEDHSRFAAFAVLGGVLKFVDTVCLKMEADFSVRTS